MKESNYRTHDLPLDEIIVPVQHMWPNCRKYTKCCDEGWNPKLERVIKMPIKVDYTIHTEKDRMKPPKGFAKW